MELIVFIIIIVSVLKYTQKSRNPGSQTPPAAAPPIQKAPLPQTSVKKQSTPPVHGSTHPKDRLAVYNRLLLMNRCQDIEKIAQELDISKFRVIRELQQLQQEGHFQNIVIDEKNYRLVYAPVKKQAEPAPLTSPAKKTQEKKNTAESRQKSDRQTKTVSEKPEKAERTFVSHSAAYQPNRNAAERFEEWFPLPKGKRALVCHYCGAQNLIPDNRNPNQYTCYFCREEL